ncbi:hypothetical protein [Methylobacterium sp. WSM2598]|uniref:hypothetical protein n=1 Tax=Methylobacterium sp. WSM2598 TaxID=398261 RepID=UPI0012F6AA6E|nr:hypothetical protein [Methylobacterium sp. WSM2598]
MTFEQRTLVQQTAEVVFVGGRFADRFYAHLFTVAPETRVLFGSDLTTLKLTRSEADVVLLADLDPFQAFRGSACRHPAESPASKHDAGACIIGLKRCCVIKEARSRVLSRLLPR